MKAKQRQREKELANPRERPPAVVFPTTSSMQRTTDADQQVVQPEVTRDSPPPAGSRIWVVTGWCEGAAARELEPLGEEVELTVKAVLPGPPLSVQAAINDGRNVKDFEWMQIWRGVQAYSRRSAGN